MTYTYTHSRAKLASLQALKTKVLLHVPWVRQVNIMIKKFVFENLHQQESCIGS